TTPALVPPSSLSSLTVYPEENTCTTARFTRRDNDSMASLRSWSESRAAPAAEVRFAMPEPVAGGAFSCALALVSARPGMRAVQSRMRTAHDLTRLGALEGAFRSTSLQNGSPGYTRSF